MFSQILRVLCYKAVVEASATLRIGTTVSTSSQSATGTRGQSTIIQIHPDGVAKAEGGSRYNRSKRELQTTDTELQGSVSMRCDMMDERYSR